MRLGNLSGNKTTLSNALITLLDKKRFELNPRAMQVLGIDGGARIDMFVTEEGDLYITKVESNTEGKHVSKTGKVQQEMMWSYLAEPNGIKTAWTVTEETLDFDGLTWNKIIVFEEDENEDNEEVATSTASENQDQSYLVVDGEDLSPFDDKRADIPEQEDYNV